MPLLMICSCDKSEVAASPDFAESARTAKVTVQASEPASTGEAGANERTRPSQRPEPKVYAKPKPPEYPPAVAVSERPGFVTSPYNGKIIDVRDIPPGTLVADPTYPTEEKKYFRTPSE